MADCTTRVVRPVHVASSEKVEETVGECLLAEILSSIVEEIEYVDVSG